MSTRSDDDRLRIVLVGWGAISHAVVDALGDAPIDIVAVARRDWSSGRDGLDESVATVSTPDEVKDLEIDLVVEAAGREAVAPWARAAVGLQADLIVSSVSAFADGALLADLRSAAEAAGTRIEIHPGALAGVDALSAARSIGLDRVEHRIVKPPRAWVGTPAETLCDLSGLTESTVFFTASAAETASAFPKNANVAMTSALAGVGPDQTRVSLVADPEASANRHEILAMGDFGELRVSIASHPLPGNPRTSAMAAHSLVRAIRNRASAIVI